MFIYIYIYIYKILQFFIYIYIILINMQIIYKNHNIFEIINVKLIKVVNN